LLSNHDVPERVLYSISESKNVLEYNSQHVDTNSSILEPVNPKSTNIHADSESKFKIIITYILFINCKFNDIIIT